MDYAEFNRKHGALYERIPGTAISLLAEYGPEVGHGWLPFLDAILTEVEREIVHANITDLALIEVKEKWGRLSIMWRGGNERIDELLATAEPLSELTCEQCGAYALLRKFENGWYAMACAECAEERGGSRIIWHRRIAD